VVEVRWVTADGVERGAVDDLRSLLDRDDGLVWVDVPAGDEQAVQVLSEVFGFHPLAIRDCVERNYVPKMHAYCDHLFIALHGPELGKGGHVHYIELDQFIGPGYLVTVHGPLNPAADPEAAFRETRAVSRRLEAGRLRPSSSFELSHAIVSTLTRQMEAFVGTLAYEIGVLEKQVMADELSEPEQSIEEMFRARHGLIAVRHMATLSREMYGRMANLTHAVTPDARALVIDIEDQFDRVHGVADGEKEFLEAAMDFYQTRTNTKMTIAAERLAVIAAVTLPVTALSSIYGMNIIVNERTDFVHLTALLAVMVTISAMLLRWAKRQGWW
jgi:magnesium transporter